MTSRPGWDDYFLAVAGTVSTRADCTRRQVGCVIVDVEHRVLSTGYNGSAPGGPSCLAGECPRGLLSYAQLPANGSYDNCHAVHAEANALLFARASCRGATVYLTDQPCPTCRRLLAAAGIARIVVV